MTRGASCWAVPARIEMGFRLRASTPSSLIDDVQHVVAASFFAVGDDVDARPVLVLGWPRKRPCPAISQTRLARVPVDDAQKQSQSCRAMIDRFACRYNAAWDSCLTIAVRTLACVRIVMKRLMVVAT